MKAKITISYEAEIMQPEDCAHKEEAQDSLREEIENHFEIDHDYEDLLEPVKATVEIMDWKPTKIEDQGDKPAE